MKNFLLYLGGAATLLTASCTGTSGWSLNGSAPDGLNETVTAYLDAPTTAGGWYTVDSVEVKPAEGFAFKGERASPGTLYRLRLGTQTIFIPLDSTETLTLDSAMRLSGSREAELLAEVEEILNNPSPTESTDRALLKALDGNYASTAAYFAARRSESLRLLRTVANRFNEERPTDPRTAVLLSDLNRKSPRKSAPDGDRQQVIYAPEISYFDFELMDRDGNMRRFSEIADTNPLTILAFVDFATSSAQAITRTLGDARNLGAAIFEVGFEQNQYLWADATDGLPWVNVYQSEAASDTHLGQYRVTDLPMFFILKNGEIVERIEDITLLIDSVKKYK